MAQTGGRKMSTYKIPSGCPFNHGVTCLDIESTKLICAKCGWNPSVDAERKAKRREEMKQKK